MRPSSRHACRHGRDRFLVGDICDDGNRLAAGLRELGDRGLRLRLVAADDRYRSARRRQAPHHPEPDAAIAAGNDGDLAA